DYELAPNMWGAEFLPQTSIIPLVDLVITHGGNNTTTEAFHFGKPMVVLPLFWDQYDNAQRVDETGFGVRLATYAFKPEDLTAAIYGLLRDVELRTRLPRVRAGIRARRRSSRWRSRAGGLGGLRPGAPVRPGDPLRDRVPGRRLAARSRRGGRRRHVRRQVPRRRAGTARPRRGMARRRDRPRARSRR